MAQEGDGRNVSGWPLPTGRWEPANGHGAVFVREVSGPEGAPVVVLLHGLGATSGLQFAATMNQLGAEFRVLALDMRRRGHPEPGLGLFDEVAEDVAVVLDGRRLSRAIVVGYSIGGLIARVLVRRRPDLVGGLVFAATFDRVPRGRWIGPIMRVGGAVAGLPRWVTWPADRPDPVRPPAEEVDVAWLPWMARELGKLHPLLMVDALREAATVEMPTIADLGDRPLAFIVTTRDRLIPQRWQRAFAATAPEAPVFEVAAGHAASGLAPGRFGPAVLAACHSVATRMSRS